MKSIIFILLSLQVFASGQYEQCYSKKYVTNDYLEGAIKEFFDGEQDCPDCMIGLLPYLKDTNDGIKGQLAQISSIISPIRSCIHESLKTMRNTKHQYAKDWKKQSYRYMYCPESLNRDLPDTVHKIYRRPCISENYVDFITYSFLEAAHCIGVNPLELFPVINQESRFHVNVGNRLGVYGASQLTGSAAAAIHQQWNNTFPKEGRKRYADAFMISDFGNLFDKPECATVKKHLGEPIKVVRCVKCSSDGKRYSIKNCVKDPKDLKCRKGDTKLTSYTARTCSRVNVPENPMKVFIYGAQLYLNYKKRAEKVVKRVKANLKNQDLDKFLEDVVLYMYNGGPYHVEVAFEAYLRTLKIDKEVDYETFAKDFEQFLLANYQQSLIDKSESRIGAYEVELEGLRTAIASKSSNLSNGQDAYEDFDIANPTAPGPDSSMDKTVNIITQNSANEIESTLLKTEIDDLGEKVVRVLKKIETEKSKQKRVSNKREEISAYARKVRQNSSFIEEKIGGGRSCDIY